MEMIHVMSFKSEEIFLMEEMHVILRRCIQVCKVPMTELYSRSHDKRLCSCPVTLFSLSLFVCVCGLHRLTFMWWRCCSLCLWYKPVKLAHSFPFCSCVCFCLYSPFNCISFHKFSRQQSVFSLCSSGPISALLVLSNIHLFMRVSLGPEFP